MCVSLSVYAWKDLSNPRTDIVLLYSEAFHRLWENLKGGGRNDIYS